MMTTLTAAEIFLLLFVTMGPPIKTPAVFMVECRGLSNDQLRTLAFKAFAFAVVAAFAGGFIGLVIAKNWHIPIPTMTLAGGVIFFFVSLRATLGRFHAPLSAPAPVQQTQDPQPLNAFQVAVPMIVTPFGLAAVIILLAKSESTERILIVCGLLLLIMVLHLLAMLFARPIMRTLGPIPLQLFGVIMDVLTVALSLQIILRALNQLGLITPSLP